MHWLLALILMIGPAFAQSSQPPIVDWIFRTQQTETQPTHQPAAADERGTDKVPFTVKVLPADGAAEQAAKAERESHDKAKIDEKLAFETQRIADYTVRLAWFTLMLFGTAVVQAGLFIWQLLYMRRGMDDARVAALAAKASADTAKEQVAVTKMGIIDLERAYLAVGPCSMQRTTKPLQGRGYTVPTDPKEVTVLLTVTNAGRTFATIEKIYGEFSRTAPIGDAPIYEHGDSHDTDLALQAGQTEILNPFEFKSGFPDPQFFWGYIEYQDIFRNKRTARFCNMIYPEDYPSKGKMRQTGSAGWRYCD